MIPVMGNGTFPAGSCPRPEGQELGGHTQSVPQLRFSRDEQPLHKAPKGEESGGGVGPRSLL